MFRLIPSSLMCFVALTFASGASSADNNVFSGPQAGEKLPSLPVLANTGGNKIGDVDFVEQAEGKAVLLVFVHDFTRPSAALTRVLMNYGEMRIGDGLFPATIRLTDDPSSSRSLRPRKATDSAYGISPDGQEGPGSYGLNRNVAVTVLVGEEGRVTSSFAIVQPSVTDAPKIIAEVVKLIGGYTPSDPEIEFLTTNPDAAARFKRNGAAPQDPHLRQQICAVLRTRTDPDSLEIAAADVEAYVGDDPHKQRELGEASRLLLYQRYKGRTAIVGASPMGDQFREWAEKFGSKPQSDG